MALLGAPALGLLISAATLHEPVGRSLVAGAVLIGAGIHWSTRRTWRRAESPRRDLPIPIGEWDYPRVAARVVKECQTARG